PLRPPAPPPRLHPPQTAQRRIDLSLPANVPRLEMLFHTPQRGHPDLYPLEVLQYVLSQGRTSRLYQRLVERERLASDVGASLSISRDPDEILLSVDLNTGASPPKAEAAVWDEIDRLAATPISEHELQQAKNTIEAHFVHEQRTGEEAASMIGEAESVGGYGYLLTYLDRIRRVTAGDVQRVARAYLQRQQASVGYLQPK